MIGDGALGKEAVQWTMDRHLITELATQMSDPCTCTEVGLMNEDLSLVRLLLNASNSDFDPMFSPADPTLVGALKAFWCLRPGNGDLFAVWRMKRIERADHSPCTQGPSPMARIIL